MGCQFWPIGRLEIFQWPIEMHLTDNQCLGSEQKYTKNTNNLIILWPLQKGPAACVYEMKKWSSSNNWNNQKYLNSKIFSSSHILQWTKQTIQENSDSLFLSQMGTKKENIIEVKKYQNLNYIHKNCNFLCFKVFPKNIFCKKVLISSINLQKNVYDSLCIVSSKTVKV